MNELIINVNDLEHNINLIKSKEKDDYTIIAVVKGNAYGCDLKQYVKVLIDNGIDYFAVASYQEAIEFRKEFYSERLLLLTPYCEEEILSDLIEKNVVLTIDNVNQAELINEIANKKYKKAVAHIKVDTGLNRYGFKYSDIASIVKIVKQNENIEFEGIYSHFANSLAQDSSFSELQYERFMYVIDKLKEIEIDFKLKHICNSSGYFKYKDMHLNAARIGSAFTGQAVGIPTDLKRIGTFHTIVTKVMKVKQGEFIGYAKSYKVKQDMKIAILPTGYSDGIGKTLVDQRFTFKSKIKRLILDFKKLFKQDYLTLGEYNVIGQIGMHDVVIDVTGKKVKTNDDMFFNVRPIYIDSSIKRIYTKD